MPYAETKDVFRVLVWKPVSQIWVVKRTCDTQEEAEEYAEASQHHDQKLRVRIKPGKALILFPDPPVVNQTRQFRQQQAQQMSDLADAKRYYKSPG